VSEELTTKSATELAQLIRSRSVSPVEVVEAHLCRIEQINFAVNAIVTLADDVLDRAIAAEAALMRSEELGPLHGVPLTVKDTIDTKGLRTTSGSVLRRHDVPKSDATVVARLRAAGAIILGKTNTSEMAIPYETDNPVFGRTNNPHNPLMTPGGSSGGEAAAIAAYLSPAGIGSDLSGSIRVPAHFCGIAGLKPTVGLVPMDGHVPNVTGIMSLGACIGPMARHVEDLALLLNVIADARAFEIKSAPEQRVGDLRALQVAWYTDDGIAPVTDETRTAVEAAAQALSDAGLAVSEERPPAVSQGSRLWIELFSRAAREQLREFYRGREKEAGPGVSSLLGETDDEPAGLVDKVNAAEKIAKAVIERERLREEILRWMKTTPLIIAPVGATPAFEHGARRVEINGQSVSVFRAFSYSQTFNVFGLPSLVVPAGRSADGLPIGVQIVGRPFEEKTLLAAAAVVEKELGGRQLG
jgi:amidase